MEFFSSVTEQYLGLSDGPARLAKAGRFGRGSPRVAGRRVHDWLAGVNGSGGDPAAAMEALAWSHALPRLAEGISPGVRQELLDALLARAVAGRTVNIETDPLLHQLTAGELAWTLAAGLPESAAGRRLAAAGRAALSAGLNRLLDRDGFLHARHRGLLGPLLACWTRCRALGERLPGGGLGPRTVARLERLARNAVRLGMVAARGATAADRRSAPGAHSEWAATAVLRRDWTAGSPRLTVFYPGRSVELELAAGGEVLGAGEWQIEVRRDGQLLPTASDWQQTCWVGDADVDYLELEIKLGDGTARAAASRAGAEGPCPLAGRRRLGRPQREVRISGRAAARARDRVPRPGRDPRGRFDGQKGTCDGPAVGLARVAAGRAGRRVGRRPGGLDPAAGDRGTAASGAVVLRSRSRAASAPIDVAAAYRGPCAVAQPADVAAGYRVAIGDRQWLIYRSLGPKANRTVLGHNLATETLLARFERSGEVESIVQIE